jgi:hypothetical protein
MSDISFGDDYAIPFLVLGSLGFLVLGLWFFLIDFRNRRTQRTLILDTSVPSSSLKRKLVARREN